MPGVITSDNCKLGLLGQWWGLDSSAIVIGALELVPSHRLHLYYHFIVVVNVIDWINA